MWGPFWLKEGEKRSDASTRLNLKAYEFDKEGREGKETDQDCEGRGGGDGLPDQGAQPEEQRQPVLQTPRRPAGRVPPPLRMRPACRLI